MSGREAVLRADVVRARDRREGTVRVHTDDLDEALDALDSLRDDAAALRRELDALRLSAAEAAGQARAECERLRADARRSDDECRRATLAAQVARSARGEAEGALARLRAVVAGRETARRGAVVEGRTTAPTDAELAAHHAAGGAWLVTFGGRGIDTRSDPAFVRVTRDSAHPPTRWWALDAAGRPTAWPAADALAAGAPGRGDGDCECGHPVEMHRGADRCGAHGCGCDRDAEEASWP